MLLHPYPYPPQVSPPIPNRPQGPFPSQRLTSAPHRPTQFPQLLSISTLSDSISSFSGSTNGIGGTPNILSESCRSSAYRVFMLRKRPSALGPFHPTHSNHRSPYGLKATLYFLQSILILPSYFLSRKNLLLII